MKKNLISLIALFLCFSCSEITQNENDSQPPAQINIEIALHHNHSFTVVWNQCLEQDFKEYRLYQAGSNDMPDRILVFSSESINDTLTVVPNISYYTFYYFQLEVIDQSGNSIESNVYKANSYPVILFESNRTGYKNIFLVDYFGKHLFQLTHGNSYDSWPRFSPDGSKFVFETDRDGNNEIYRFDFNDFQIFNLTNHPGHDIDPYFTTDGERILFISDRTGNNNVFRVKLDGSYQRQVTYQDAELKWPCASTNSFDYSVVTNSGDLFYNNLGSHESNKIAHLPEYLGMARISPNGKEIAVTSAYLEIMTSELHFINLLDGTVENIDGAHDAKYNPLLPIVYYTYSSSIVEKNLESGETRTLIQDINGWVDTISNDGQTLILTDFSGSNADIYRVDKDGTQLVKLTTIESENRGGRIQPMP